MGEESLNGFPQFEQRSAEFSEGVLKDFFRPQASGVVPVMSQPSTASSRGYELLVSSFGTDCMQGIGVIVGVTKNVALVIGNP